MRRIIKKDSPDWLKNWKTEFKIKHGAEPTYRDLQSRERRKLREQLLEEQGYICCYCMRRIDIKNSHVEHFWPRESFPDLSLDYSNMLASCDGEAELVSADHCGHRKNNWYDKKMVIPTEAAVEVMFHYSADGHISPADKNEKYNIEAAEISQFGLDSFYLVRNRRMAIEASELFDEREYSKEEWWDILAYYDTKDNGKYQEYCNAIIDVIKGMYLAG